MKKRIYAAVLFLCMILASGCTSGKHMEDAGMYIYYLNTDDDALEKQEYENNSEKAETVVKDMLKELKKAPESIEMKSQKKSRWNHSRSKTIVWNCILIKHMKK